MFGFLKKWRFKCLDFCKKGDLNVWIFVKYEVLNVWIFEKMALQGIVDNKRTLRFCGWEMEWI